MWHADLSRYDTRVGRWWKHSSSDSWYAVLYCTVLSVQMSLMNTVWTWQDDISTDEWCDYCIPKIRLWQWHLRPLSSGLLPCCFISILPTTVLAWQIFTARPHCLQCRGLPLGMLISDFSQIRISNWKTPYKSGYQFSLSLKAREQRLPISVLWPSGAKSLQLLS